MPHENYPPREEPFPWPAEASVRPMRQVAEHSPDLVKDTLDFVWQRHAEALVATTPWEPPLVRAATGAA
jgi:hypothetical protein